MSTGLGLFRDFVAAVLGLALIFEVLDQTQAGGVLLVFVTAAAFGTWAYQAYRGRRHA